MKSQRWQAKAEELQQVAEKKRYESFSKWSERLIRATEEGYNTAF